MTRISINAQGRTCVLASAQDFDPTPNRNVGFSALRFLGDGEDYDSGWLTIFLPVGHAQAYADAINAVAAKFNLQADERANAGEPAIKLGRAA